MGSQRQRGVRDGEQPARLEDLPHRWRRLEEQGLRRRRVHLRQVLRPEQPATWEERQRPVRGLQLRHSPVARFFLRRFFFATTPARRHPRPSHAPTLLKRNVAFKKKKKKKGPLKKKKKKKKKK